MRLLAKKSQIVRDVGVVAGSAVLAHGLTLIVMPLLTRLYDPTAFGILGIFTAIGTYLTLVCTGSYHMAVVVAAKKSKARELAFLSLYIAITTSSIVGAIGFFVFHSDSLGKHFIEQRGLLLLFPFLMLAFAFRSILEHWTLREKKFALLSYALIAQSVCVNFFKVFGGIIWGTGAVLAGLATVAPAFLALFLAMQFRLGSRNYGVSFKAPNHTMSQTRWAQITQVAYEFRQFPLYRTPQAIVNTISMTAPVLFLAVFFGSEMAGYYFLAIQTLAVPSVLIGTAVGQVFFPTAAEAVREGRSCYRELIRLTAFLTLVGIPTFGIVAIYGPHLFQLVFGPDWTMSGNIAQVLSLWLLFGFANRPSMVCIPVFALEKFLFYWEILTALFRVAVLWAALYVGMTVVQSLLIFSVAGACANVFLVGYVFSRARHHGEVLC